MKNNILEAHLYQKVMYMTTAEKKIGFRRCVHEKKKKKIMHTHLPRKKLIPNHPHLPQKLWAMRHFPFDLWKCIFDPVCCAGLQRTAQWGLLNIAKFFPDISLRINFATGNFQLNDRSNFRKFIVFKFSVGDSRRKFLNSLHSSCCMKRLVPYSILCRPNTT